MILRNARYNSNGGIDCEVNHPDYGWIPYTIPDDGRFQNIAMFELAAQTAEPYVPDEAEELKSAIADKIEEINAAYTAAVTPMIRDYPEIEQSTWWAQEGEARAYLAWFDEQQGEPPATPVLDNILAGRNGDDGSETLWELCLAVMENAAMFTQAQQMTGKRQRLAKQARSVETRDALDAIDW
ncbi:MULTISPECIES: hypothetical protein [unclassified Halomonas]|uniref:hypothetical protein n=1 Tax=unclassified Halomonas TaxID=2609666 RepID=UPI0020768EFA|nr:MULTISPECIES: hypothetical protein [unclassified Halomonas]